MKNIKIISILVVLILTSVLTGCNKNETDTKLKILFEDTSEVAIYRRDTEKQILQIPLVVNKKIANCELEEILGENLNVDQINFSYAFNSEYKSNYMYIITFEFNPNYIAISNEDVLIKTLKLKMDNEIYNYNVGNVKIINKVISNQTDMVYFKGLGTGYCDLSFLDFSLGFNEDVEILEICTTNNLKLKNDKKYLKKYFKDNSENFMIDVEKSNYKKLYYAFDIFVRYKCKGKEYVYYYTHYPVQIHLANRLDIFIDEKG